MILGNQLNSAIVSYMLKKHKKIRIMTYIADKQSFTPPQQISCQTKARRIRIFPIHAFGMGQKSGFKPQSKRRNAEQLVLGLPTPPKVPYRKASLWEGLLWRIPLEKTQHSKLLIRGFKLCQRHPFGINTTFSWLSL